MIRGMTFREPEEIQTVPGHVLQLATGPHATTQAIQPQPGDHTRMNRRLASKAVILRFPARPIKTIKQLADQPHGMVRRDDIIQRSRKQNLLATRLRRLCPIPHPHSPPTIRSISSFLRRITYLSLKSAAALPKFDYFDSPQGRWLTGLCPTSGGEKLASRGALAFGLGRSF